MYAPELSTMPADERRRLLIVLEALTDVESWARMREFFALSFEEACEAWVRAIDRLLPATPGGPGQSGALPRQSVRFAVHIEWLADLKSTRSVLDRGLPSQASSDRRPPPAERADQAVDHRSLPDAAA